MVSLDVMVEIVPMKCEGCGTVVKVTLKPNAKIKWRTLHCHVCQGTTMFHPIQT